MYPIPHYIAYFPGSFSLCLPADNLLAFSRELVCTRRISPLLAPEEHQIHVTPDGITLTASTDEGFFRAATTLFQLAKEHAGQIPCLFLHDRPALARRGYMLDISRGKIPTVATIKRYIDLLALLKYNEFQLYMDNNCFQYDAFAKYTADFDCLTPADIRELDEYCAQRFIDLVPNQNSLGHMEYWLSQEEFRHLGLSDETHPESTTLNPLLPESMAFLDKFYASLLPNFRSGWLNVGMDEAYELGKFQMADYTALHGKDHAFMEHLNRVDALVRDKYGKRIMFWADMIYKYKDLYHQIPKDAIALEWGYELIQSQTMTAHCIEFQQAGVPFYVCPSCNTHLSFTGRFDVTSFNIRTAAEIARDTGAKGILLTDWGNGGHPHFPVWSLVPIALCGQYGWNIGAEQNGETFKAEFIHAAEKFIDDTVFGGVGVSRLLYRMSNYYLLEPERVHVGTMCCEIFYQPLNETEHAPYFDLKVCGDDFYFDNVIAYTQSLRSRFAALAIEECWKRQILLGTDLVILASEYCKLRMAGWVDAQKKAALAALSDAIDAEFQALWLQDNYPEGMQLFLSTLSDRKTELLALPERNPL